MRREIGFLVLGIILGATLVLAAGGTPRGEAPTGPGRYQFQIDGMQIMWLLDTHTGRLWYGPGGQAGRAWAPVNVTVPSQ